MIHKLINTPFKSLFLPCILALFCFQHPVHFNHPIHNQFARWSLNLENTLIFYNLHFQPIFPHVCQCHLDRPSTANINRLTKVRAPARDMLDFYAQALDFFNNQSHHVDAKSPRLGVVLCHQEECFPRHKTLFQPQQHHTFIHPSLFAKHKISFVGMSAVLSVQFGPFVTP